MKEFNFNIPPFRMLLEDDYFMNDLNKNVFFEHSVIPNYIPKHFNIQKSSRKQTWKKTFFGEL